MPDGETEARRRKEVTQRVRCWSTGHPVVPLCVTCLAVAYASRASAEGGALCPLLRLTAVSLNSGQGVGGRGKGAQWSGWEAGLALPLCSA